MGKLSLTIFGVLFLTILVFFLIQFNLVTFGTGNVVSEEVFSDSLDIGIIKDPGTISICGNGLCGKGENETSCPEDCLPELNRTCTDSDSGIEVFSYGSCVQTIYYVGGGSASGANDVCSISLNSLSECYCEENQLETIEVSCEFGCGEGVCLNESEINYTIQNNFSCTESDGGFESFIYGYCGIELFLNDASNEISTNPKSGIWDGCVNESVLRECSCGLLGIEVGLYDCAEGCFEGVCLGEEPIQNDSTDNSTDKEISEVGSCIETDKGIDYYSIGFAENNKKKLSDTCYDKNTLLEVYCSGEEIQISSFDCLNGCFAGMCLPEAALGIGEITFPCNDSDGGLNYPIKGFANDGFGTLLEDSCLEEGPYAGYLFEYYCSDKENEEFSNKLNYQYVSCKNGCFEGVCNPRDNWFSKFIRDIFS